MTLCMSALGQLCLLVGKPCLAPQETTLRLGLGFNKANMTFNACNSVSFVRYLGELFPFFHVAIVFVLFFVVSN